LKAKKSHWHQHEWVKSRQETEGETDSSVVSQLAHDNVASLIGFVQMNAILMGLNTGKSAVVVRIPSPSSENCEELPNE
jgi:hypothetical protein